MALPIQSEPDALAADEELFGEAFEEPASLLEPLDFADDSASPFFDDPEEPPPLSL